MCVSERSAGTGFDRFCSATLDRSEDLTQNLGSCRSGRSTLAAEVRNPAVVGCGPELAVSCIDQCIRVSSVSSASLFDPPFLFVFWSGLIGFVTLMFGATSVQVDEKSLCSPAISYQ